jgi:hypothetical protein
VNLTAFWSAVAFFPAVRLLAVARAPRLIPLRARSRAHTPR